ARSRIKDVDVAAESARLTQTKILSQAGLSVLSQANAAPEMALALLRN
ncbi:flagellin, partial [bacterium]|nr:flagellin [bacterium]